MKVNVGDILLCVNPRISRKHWYVIEIEDLHVVLLDANKTYSERKGLGDYWRVSNTFLEDNFIQF